MALTIPIFNDSSFSSKFMDIPIVEIPYSGFSHAIGQITIGGKQYSGWVYSSGTFKYIAGVPRSSYENSAFLSYLQSRIPTERRLYFKNGLSAICQERAMSGSSNGVMQFDSLRYNDISVSGQNNESIVNALNEVIVVGFTLQYNGITYIGFTTCLNLADGRTPYFEPYIMVESQFWLDALNPAYAYGTGTDITGGTGSGKISAETVGRSATPTAKLPTGGTGLHAYKINAAAFSSLQGFLWGESSTLAKSLWQKFVNKTHDPISCVVACYRLPSAFMPYVGSSAAGIQLAGTMLAPIAGSCLAVDLGIDDSVILEFPRVEQPFQNFLDYTGISCKINVPFCGEFSAPVESVYGRTVRIYYRVDQQNGNIAAYVDADGTPLAELTGNCAYSIPVVGGDSGMLERIGAIATAGLQLAAGNAAGALGSAASAAAIKHNTQLVNASLSGSVAACLNGRAYMIWTQTTTAYPAGYAANRGLPARSAYGIISKFTGYGELDLKIQDLNIPEATAAEKEEIVNLLRGGVIV